MSDYNYTNDIDNLLHDLAKRRLLVWHSVVTALVAERNALVAEHNDLKQRFARLSKLWADEVEINGAVKQRILARAAQRAELERMLGGGA